MRLGVFGGSFDPVHRGHLLLANCCAEQAKLDEVRFIPTAHQPLKPSGPQASDEHRLAMLRLVDVRSMTSSSLARSKSIAAESATPSTLWSYFKLSIPMPSCSS